MQLNWQKCQGEVWCKLNFVNLDHPIFTNLEGVYVIWHGGPNPATVYVGSGVIRDRITEHRRDLRIQSYNQLGLFVTWSAVPQESRKGVEAFLIGKLAPIVTERSPTDIPVEVNSPW